MIDATTSIVTDEYHTGGEPYRIVVDGVPTPIGTTVLDRRQWCQEHLDDVRAFVVNEPRGHADMYGCFVTPPDPDEDREGTGAFGMVFFHKDGFSTACGHGTIAGVTWAIDTGRVAPIEPTTEVFVDVPSGRVRAEADVAGGQVRSVRFENVPSFVTATDHTVEVGGRSFAVDVSYGGAFYASADVAQLGVSITPEHLPTLTETGRAIKWALDDDHPTTRHPDDPRLSGCYGTIWFERLGVGPDGELRQRNVTIFADGEVDRSPCGSGTSARLALLDHRGELDRGQVLLHGSVVGSSFTGRVLGDGPDISGRTTVRTQVGGRAHRTGTATFTYDPDDELGLGFQLR
jgi:proline racemase